MNVTKLLGYVLGWDYECYLSKNIWFLFLGFLENKILFL